MKNRNWALIVPLAAGLACAEAGQEDTSGGTIDLAALDAVFAEFSDPAGPGCAVAASRDGQQVMARAYGMASLEWDVANTPETVFEPGSVSKQFTAAATIMLVLDGAISLEDDIRDYLPEIPDYGEPITVQMLLNHTSGLRDWGSIAGIEGWGRTTRVHTHKHVLDIASRQEALNYEPGQYYSYTNTGYNLQAVLIERVSGMTFDEFSQERIFQPLGMTRTQWRDDFTEIVEDRAVGYVKRDDDEWHMLMPFENVHGNGGLLTTVGDLLKFTHNLDTGDVGGPEFIRLMHRQGVLDSGRQISYASGLQIGEYKGLREVRHGGSTAGYRGFLTRFPDNGVAVSLMCNAANANPGRLAHAVADLYLADAISEDEPPIEMAIVDLDASLVGALAGGYRDTRSNQFVELTADGARLSLRIFGNDVELQSLSPTEFRSPIGVRITFEATPAAEGRPTAMMDTPVADDVHIVPVDEFDPTPAQLAEYAGAYHSDEAEVTYWVEVEDGDLVMKDRYGDGETLEPVYPDAFTQGGSTFVFRRDAGGRITQVSLSQGRVWDLRFERVDRLP